MWESEAIFWFLSSWETLKDIKWEMAETLFKNCHCAPTHLVIARDPQKMSRNIKLYTLHAFHFITKQKWEERMGKKK